MPTESTTPTPSATPTPEPSGTPTPIVTPAVTLPPPRTPTDVPAVGLPRRLQAGVDERGVFLEWQGADNVVLYYIERKQADGAYDIVGAIADRSQSWLDETVVPGTTYTYRVRAIGAGGDSQYSNEVTVTVPRLVDVPNLVGLLEWEIREEVGRIGLRLEVVPTEESDQPAGTIIRQQPGAGQRVPVGSTITVWTAAARSVEVPDVVGMELEQARKVLESNALELVHSESEPSDHPEGTIVRQEPEPGATVPAGSTVLVTVATAPDVPCCPTPTPPDFPVVN
jgi:hypothetical protein